MTVDELWDAWGFCGCDLPGETIRFVSSILGEDSGTEDLVKRIKKHPKQAARLIAYWLNSVDLTEHNFSINRWQVTEKGTAILSSTGIARREPKL